MLPRPTTDAMTLRQSSIFIDRLRLYARHGVMAQEQAVGAEFVVSLRVQYDISRAMATDDVAATLSYADLCRTVEQQMAEPSHLLEHAAARIASAIFTQYPQATALDLRLTKVNPPMGADCEGAGIDIHLTND